MKVFKLERIKLFKTEFFPSQKKIVFNTQKFYKNIMPGIPKPIPKPLPEKIPEFFLKKKTYRFNVEKYIEKNCLKTGRWSPKEHLAFLDILDKYGADWKKANALIGNRTSIQIRTHANKFFKKLKRYKDEDLGIDFTSNSIKNLNDMIKHIKNVNRDYSVYNIFLINSEKNPFEKKKSNETEETQDKESKDDINNDNENIESDKDKKNNKGNNTDIEKENNSTKEISVNPKENINKINNKPRSCFNPININSNNNDNNKEKENKFYDYLNHAIFTNVLNIISLKKSDILRNYLQNLRNCLILDIKYNNLTTDDVWENIEEN